VGAEVRANDDITILLALILGAMTTIYILIVLN